MAAFVELLQTKNLASEAFQNHEFSVCFRVDLKKADEENGSRVIGPCWNRARPAEWNRASRPLPGDAPAAGWEVCWRSNGVDMNVSIAEEFAAELAAVGDNQELEHALLLMSNRLGFDHFALTLEPRPNRHDAGEILLHDYPDEWAKVYIGFDLAGRDPVRRACDKSFIGFAWDAIAALVPLTRGDRQMLAVGRECGLGNGYTVPRHLPGLVRGSCTFVVGPSRDLPTANLPLAELIGAIALSRALGLSGFAPEPELPRLSDRQRECVLWVARGKTAAETALILDISIETVIQHLKLARERYEVHCKQSLILAAMFDGLIGFGDVFRIDSPSLH